MIHVATFLSAHSAIAGILVSCLEKYPETVEVTKLYASQRSFRELELLKRQSASKSIDVSPRIHISRPPASYAASHPRGLHPTQGPRQLVPAQTLPRHSQRIPFPSSPPRTNGPAPLMLHREVHGPVGQAPRNQPIFLRVDNLQTPPDNDNLSPITWNTQKVNERDMWKQKFLS